MLIKSILVLLFKKPIIGFARYILKTDSTNKMALFEIILAIILIIIAYLI